MAFSYKYPRPAVTVDCVVFGFDYTTLKLLLVERGIEPFKGMWALPGGFVQPTESLDEAARRELQEEAGLQRIFLEQLYTFGKPNRDPRGRVITVAYFALVKLMDHRVVASTDATSAAWWPVAALPKLAFDHKQIISVGLQRLKGKVRYQPIGFELLPPKFTLSQLQGLYETILGESLDKRNFRKKILSMKLLTPLNEKQTGVAHRAAQLYCFNERKYKELIKSGYLFEL